MKTRTIRLTGFYGFMFITFLIFLYSLGYAFNIYEIFGIEELAGEIFNTLIFFAVFFLFLVFIATFFDASRALFRRKTDKRNFSEKNKTAESLSEERTDKEKSKTQTGKIDADMIEHQLKFVFIPGRISSNQTYKLILIFFIGAAANFFFRHLLGFQFKFLLIFEILFGVLTAALVLPVISGAITGDILRSYIKGYHVHESFVGIYFVFIGVPLLSGGFGSTEFTVGLLFLTAGIFLIGRDAHDLAQGKIIVHFKKEDDYRDYLRLKNRRNEILKNAEENNYVN